MTYDHPQHSVNSLQYIIYNIHMRQGAKARIIHYQQPQKQQVQAPKTYRKAPHIPENHHYQLKI